MCALKCDWRVCTRYLSQRGVYLFVLFLFSDTCDDTCVCECVCVGRQQETSCCVDNCARKETEQTHIQPHRAHSSRYRDRRRTASDIIYKPDKNSRRARKPIRKMTHTHTPQPNTNRTHTHTHTTITTAITGRIRIIVIIIITSHVCVFYHRVCM